MHPTVPPAAHASFCAPEWDICRHIRQGARFWGHRPAVECGDETLSFAGLDTDSDRLAAALLALGLRPGDRVAVQSRNAVGLVVLETALLKAGLVKVALNARFTADEVLDVMSTAAPAVFCAGDGFAHAPDTPGFDSVRHFISLAGPAPGYHTAADLMAQAPQGPVHVAVGPEALAVLHFSSGSTGRIKAAMQTYGNRMACIRKVLFRNEGAPRPGDRLALVGPITHASGMLMQPFLYAGATLHLFERFQPKAFLAAVQQHRITHAFMVPAMIHALLEEPDLARCDLSSLRQLTYGAAPMAPARIEEAWRRIGPVLAQGYGLSESTSAVLALSTRDHAEALASAPHRLASCGRPYGETEVKVVNAQGHEVSGDEIGEIVVRGPDVFAGYWESPELTAEAVVDGWLRTGDLARVDEQGFVYIVDRKKDMLVSGGFNVYPTEVEAALYRHPAVYEVCVIGVPDERWGEAVKAVVVPRPGMSISAEELISHCRPLLADYKRPRSVDFVGALPKNPNGKLARKAVREPFWAGRERQVH